MVLPGESRSASATVNVPVPQPRSAHFVGPSASTPLSASISIASRRRPSDRTARQARRSLRHRGTWLSTVGVARNAVGGIVLREDTMALGTRRTMTDRAARMHERADGAPWRTDSNAGCARTRDRRGRVCACQIPSGFDTADSPRALGLDMCPSRPLRLAFQALGRAASRRMRSSQIQAHTSIASP
jgi:hypothetical protein